MVNQQIIDLSKRVAEILSDTEKRAIATLKVFIIGSYHKEDKVHLENLRDKLLSQEITAFLMEDIEVKTDNFKEKFKAIWKYMTEGANKPLFILFAGKSAANSQGFITELVEIANDKDKLDVAYLFRTNGVKLPHHAKCYINGVDVPTGKVFVKAANTLVLSKIENIKQFLDVS